MRNAFADEITQLVAKNTELVLLSGDIGNRLFDKFKEQAPNRFYNCGVAEANMIGVASGLAMSGFHPVVYTITPFTTTRVMEQIRVDVCYHNVPVTIVGTGSGLSYASLGPTHHSCEDMAMLRSLPGMSIFAPADANEVRGCLRAALQHPGPVYMRIGKKGEPVVHDHIPDVQIGKNLTIRKGNDISILAVGVMLPTALQVADNLEKEGVSTGVISAVSVKPLDEKNLEDIFKHTNLVVTIEEHGLIGGFGSAVAEWMIDKNISNRELVRFAAVDKFIHQSGETSYARKLVGLDADNITRTLLSRIETVA